MSFEQASLLAAHQPSEVVILFDPDEAGRKGAIVAYRRLSPHLPVAIAHCPLGSDPADLGRERCLRIVADVAGQQLAPLGHCASRRLAGLRRLPSLGWTDDR